MRGNMVPNFDEIFRLDTDACDYGVGASLKQPSIDNKEQWQPVAFFSKHLSESQQKYSTCTLHPRESYLRLFYHVSIFENYCMV